MHKKLVSLFLSLTLLAGSGLSVAMAQSVEQDLVNFMKEFNLTSCFSKFPEQTTRMVTAFELGCLLVRSTGDKTLTTFSAFRKVKNQGIFKANTSNSKTFGQVEMMEAGMKAYGISIPNLIPDSKWPYTDMKKNPTVLKAIEIGVLKPLNDTKIGIRTAKKTTRAEALSFLYKLSLIESANESIFSNPEPQTININFGGGSSDLNVLESTIENIKLKSYYREQFDGGKAVNEAIKTVVSTLNDPYSEYYTPEENERFFQSLGGDIEGIGAYIEKKDEAFVIISPIRNSPAEKAGLKAGDIITHVNGTSLEGVALQDGISLIKGPAGTTVTLKVQRNGSNLEIKVVREKINIPSLILTEVDGYFVIQLLQFSLSAAEDLRPILERAQKERPAGIILDVRNNPGGFLHVVVEMLDFFLEPETPLVQIESKELTTISTDLAEPIVEGIPMAVLINKGSASASEILAGTLQDYGMAKIIGETSFGKGSVQEVISFFDGSALKLTTALWLTGKGKSIDHIGVKPDIEAFDNPETTDVDEALRAALVQLGASVGRRR